MQHEHDAIEIADDLDPIVRIRLSAQERARLHEYEIAKGMSANALMRQALRLYDAIERTPGALEALRGQIDLPVKSL